jgi:Sporulation and spore germination.
MKKRILIMILAGLFCLTACEQSQDNPPTEPVTQDEQEKPEDDNMNEDEEDDQDGEPQEEKPDKDREENQGTDQNTEGTTKITIYSCNEDATAFATSEVELDSLTPQAVLDALFVQGAVSADVKINSLEKSTVDGEDTILIDFNSAFASYVSSMGSAGEYYAVGSVCNTFLDAYFCDQIKITVDGATLETGHMEYSGYFGKFS